MTKKKIVKEFFAVLVAFISLITGYLIYDYILKNQTDIDGIVIVTLLIIPFLLYFLVSGKIKEIRGPADLQIKFASATNEKIKPSDILQIKYISPRIKKGTVTDNSNIEYEKPSKKELGNQPNTVRIKLENPEVNDKICDYLDQLEVIPSLKTLKYIVFVSPSGDFEAMIPLSSPQLKDNEGDCTTGKLIDRVERVEDSDINLETCKGYRSYNDGVSSSFSKRQCLEIMLKDEVDALPIIDNRILKGVIEKTKLIENIILDVAAEIDE